MLNWMKYYESNRLDSNLCYVETKEGIALSTFVLIKADVSHTAIINEKCSFVKDTDKHIIIRHPLSQKIHTCLYTNGSDVLDGYGIKWDNVSFSNNKLTIDGERLDIHIMEFKNNSTFYDNIRQKSPMNLYGFIPDENITLLSPHNFNKLVFVSELDEKEIISSYENPNSLKNFIKNIDLLLYRFLNADDK